MPQWTNAQQNAIDARGGTILVSAAAGSGKTAVLVERIIKAITDEQNKLPANKLLVVTFTTAAAEEMKTRIEKALSERIKVDRNNAFLIEQKRLLSRATISTVDSFCNKLVKDYFYLLDIKSDFKIIDESIKKTLMSEAMENVLEKNFETGENYLADFFSNEKNDNGLKLIVNKIYDFTRSHLFPDEWLTEITDSYDPEIQPENTIWGKLLIEDVKDNLVFHRKKLEEAFSSIEPTDKPYQKLQDYFLGLKDSCIGLIDMVENGAWDNIGVKLKSFSFENFPTPRGHAQDPDIKYLKSIADSYKDYIKNKCKAFYDSSEQIKSDISGLSYLITGLAGIVRDYSKEYDRLKLEQNSLDFSDVEHLAVKLLVEKVDGEIRRTELARLISERYDMVMIDEYQDTNEVQDYIFKAVAKEGDTNRFMVGDVKQSIYGFRLANPDIFVKYKNTFAEYNADEEVFPALINLDRNFRSGPEIINTVNFIFSQLMSEKMGGVDYSEETGDSLVLGREDIPECESSATLLDLISANEEEDNDISEAKHIADRIRTMISNGDIIKNGSGERPVKYSDFTILLRSFSSHALNYVNELKKQGIPCYAEIAEDFFSLPEVLTVMSFLKVIDNPDQDIPLLAVLFSPVYGFIPDEILKLRLDNRRDSLYVLLRKSDNEKIKAFLKDIEYYRVLASHMQSDEFISLLYERTDLLNIVSAMPYADSRIANLNMLLEYAQNFASSGYVSLSSFVRLMSKIENDKTDIKAANQNSDSENAVRVMTIHKSKGLEFPITIIAGCSRKFNFDNEITVLDSVYGFGTKLMDSEYGIRYNNIVRDAIKLNAKRKELAEEMRVLYVAMTRASKKLIFVASVNKDKLGEKIQKLMSPDKRIPASQLVSTSSFTDWLLACAVKHPDAHVLRQYAGYDDSVVLNDYYSKWNVNIIEGTPETKVDENEELTEYTVNEKLLNKIQENCLFEYKNEGLNDIPTKVTASNLAGENEFINILPRPSFMSSEGLSPAERGTAFHKYMQYSNYEKAAQDAQYELNRLLNEGFITEAESKVIDVSLAEQFFSSSLGKEILSADELHRERKFSVLLNPEEIGLSVKPEFTERKITLQGAIDLDFEKDGKIYIVDFKTDRVKDISELKDRYKVQLDLYRNALSQITGEKVEACYIYSIRLGNYIEI